MCHVSFHSATCPSTEAAALDTSGTRKRPDNNRFREALFQVTLFRSAPGGSNANIYVKQKIAQGLDDVRAGRVVSQEDVEKRFARWLEE